MTPEAFLATIIERNIAVMPVLRRGKKKGTVVVNYWFAGFRQLGSDGVSNGVNNDQCATGSTPIDAVEKLLAGKTVYINDPEHGLIRRADLPTPGA